ncbi:ATP-binding protein [Paractinoplanes ferrugineus]|uniref:histidine kinase n=1 Tax=Paractinoplanes ferrugineus TaxID=113564 RepID=A0A919MJM3_9ACTN|nr:ATP-binding protein [Actinoplanes ferrugineus]GIE10307.1 histidine kinase [Actinoplanes ferrugineus]
MSRLRAGSWTLRSRVTALFTVAGIVLAGIGVFAVVTASAVNGHLDTILDKTGPMRVAGQELYSAYLDQETGIRGYVLSRSDKNLEPYQRGVAAEALLVAEIERLNGSGGRASIAADLANVRLRSREWRSTVAEPVIGDPAGTRQPDEAAATARFDAVRAAVDRLQADILALRNEAAGAARRTGSVLLTLVIAAAVIVALVGALLLLLLDRLITRPVTELASHVREVADGDFDRRITSSGSPEMVSLAADVDGMRRRIAAELTVVRDARAEVEAKAEELTRSNRDLEQFAYVASHDLQEPLRKVASFCQLLQRRYAGQLDERADQYIGFAVDGASRMQRLINDLLAFSRIGRMTTGFKRVELDRVVEDAVSQLEHRTDDAQVVWSGLPAVEGEEPLLTTLFVNLVGNSLKFRRPDVPPVVRVTAQRDGDDWAVNVRDNGIGIEAEFADKVFVIFQRLHPRDAYEGTGIGLAIVKKIVEYHGGRIWLDLEVAEGSSIWFTLSASRTAEEPADVVGGEELGR